MIAPVFGLVVVGIPALTPIATYQDIRSMSISCTGDYALGFADGHIEVRGHDGLLKAEFIERGTVSALAYSPDGKQLATGFQDDGRNVTTGLWTADGRLVRYFDALQQRPSNPTDQMAMYSYKSTGHLAWSPDGKLLAAEHGGHMDTGVRIWDTQGRLVSTLSKGSPISAGVGALRFSPTGKRLVTGTDDGFLKCWSVDGSCEWQVKVSSRDSICDADFSPDGKQISFSTSWQDRRCGAVKAADGCFIGQKRSASDWSYVRYAAKGKVLADGRCVTVADGNRSIRRDEFPSPVTLMVLSPNRKVVLLTTRDHSLYRYFVAF